MDRLHLEKIFLLEIFIDHVSFSTERFEGTPETSAEFEFLRFPLLFVCEDGPSSISLGPDEREITFDYGMTFLFMASKGFQYEDAVLMFTIARNDVFDKEVLGKGEICFGKEFFNMLQLCENQANGPQAKTVRGIYTFKDRGGISVGKAGLFMRLSFFENIPSTQFFNNASINQCGLSYSLNPYFSNYVFFPKSCSVRQPPCSLCIPPPPLLRWEISQDSFPKQLLFRTKMPGWQPKRPNIQRKPKRQKEEATPKQQKRILQSIKFSLQTQGLPDGQIEILDNLSQEEKITSKQISSGQNRDNQNQLQENLQTKLPPFEGKFSHNTQFPTAHKAQSIPNDREERPEKRYRCESYEICWIIGEGMRSPQAGDTMCFPEDTNGDKIVWVPRSARDGKVIWEGEKLNDFY